ncbi:phenylacetate--CoA ligase family protein [Brevibacillus ginsengisoli]|uniref:phenylacetate--CoA ligase family protein n=1 Tax=Brevibacillus ginsengisoli TaxID=363854 RepID=UPI003CE887CE
MSIHGWLIRNIQWPLMEKRKGNQIRQFMREMDMHGRKPVHELEQIKRHRLTKLLAHAVHRVPAYQRYQSAFEKAIHRPDWDPVRFLQEIPVLTKKDFNHDPYAYMTKGIQKASLIANRTGGSTGEPTRFYLDRHTIEHYEAARWTGLSWHGIRIGDPSVMIWGSPIELSQQQSRNYALKERLLKNRKFIPAYDLQETKLHSYVELLRKYRPMYLYGYASALALFAKLLEKHQLIPKVTRLKAVVSTAENLLPEQREVIERVFQCPVVNEYGARDGGIIAFQCPQRQMHLFENNCLVEVVDLTSKKPVQAGEHGLILVTDLHNYSMPRLRYQLNDVVTLSPKPCSCGLTSPVLERIEGREDDVFVKSNGEYVHGHFFNHIARNLSGIESFQIVQHSPEAFTLQVVKNPDHCESQAESQFVERIRQSFGDVYINVQYQEQIPATPSGKIRYAIREFPLTTV